MGDFSKFLDREWSEVGESSECMSSTFILMVEFYILMVQMPIVKVI